MSPVKTAVSAEIKRRWQALFKKITKLLRYLWRVKLKPVSQVKFEVLEVNYTMRKARVKLSWNPSPADDVLHQIVKVVDPDDGQIFYDAQVGPEVTEVVLPELLNEKQRLQAVIIPSDGVNEGDAVVVDWTVPDLTKPAPVTDATFTYEGVDVEEEDTEIEGN